MATNENETHREGSVDVQVYLTERGMLSLHPDIISDALTGNAEAQCALGLCIQQGLCVPRDLVVAAVLFRLAAEQDHAKAQCALGSCYAEGRGVEIDHFKAFELYTNAARVREGAHKGLALAIYNLGVCYEKGTGINQNYSQAVQYFEKAAALGDAGAQYNLGVGHQKVRNYDEAVRFYGLAALQNLPEAQYALGVLHATGKGVAENLSEAAVLFKAAADLGHSVAQFEYGVFCEDGIGSVSKDMSSA